MLVFAFIGRTDDVQDWAVPGNCANRAFPFSLLPALRMERERRYAVNAVKTGKRVGVDRCVRHCSANVRYPEFGGSGS